MRAHSPLWAPRACIACLVPWLGLAVSLASLMLLSLAISGQIWMFSDLSGILRGRGPRGAGPPPAVRWSEFDEAASSSAPSSLQEVVASIARYWGRDSMGKVAQSLLPPLSSSELRLPRGRLFVTLVGAASWLHGSPPDDLWAPYADASLGFQFRAKACPSSGGGLSPNAPSGPGDVHVVVLGRCLPHSRGVVGMLGLYLEVEQAAARAEAIRRSHSSATAPVIVYSMPQPPSHSQSENFVGMMTWEQRHSAWWGWEVLSGRMALRGGGKLPAALAPAAEARQLQDFLAVSHLAAHWGVLPVWPFEGEGRATPRKTLRVLLAQLRFLQDGGDLPPSAHKGTTVPITLLCGPLLLTRKYHPECLPQPSAPVPLLLTSLGGAGTHGAAASLQRAGAAVQHEGLGRGGAVAWMYAVNDAALRTSYPFRAILPLSERGVLSPRFQSVVHLVRHPLRHLASFAGHLSASHDFVRFAATGIGSALEELLAAWTEGRQGREGRDGTGRLPGEHALSISARVTVLHRLLTLASAIVAVPHPAPSGPLFPALAWLFWDALVDLQADSRLRVEGGEGSKGLEALGKLVSGAGGDSAYEQEASLLHGLLAAAYGGYNQLAGLAKPRLKRPHGGHSELSWDDLAALAPCPSPGHAPVHVLREVRARANLYGYNDAAADNSGADFLTPAVHTYT